MWDEAIEPALSDRPDSEDMVPATVAVAAAVDVCNFTKCCQIQTEGVGESVFGEKNGVRRSAQLKQTEGVVKVDDTS